MNESSSPPHPPPTHHPRRVITLSPPELHVDHRVVDVMSRNQLWLNLQPSPGACPAPTPSARPVGPRVTVQRLSQASPSLSNTSSTQK